jgi:hypothetical protein
MTGTLHNGQRLDWSKSWSNNTDCLNSKLSSNSSCALSLSLSLSLSLLDLAGADQLASAAAEPSSDTLDGQAQFISHTLTACVYVSVALKQPQQDSDRQDEQAYNSRGGSTSTTTRCHALLLTPRKFQIPAAVSGCVLYAESIARATSSTEQVRPFVEERGR